MKTKIKVLAWQEVYTLPIEKQIGNYAWTSNDVMAITFKGISPYDRSRIIRAINGELPNKVDNLTHTGPTFYINNVEVFSVRGWGHLTGIGALHLPKSKAEKIQDGFIKHIFNILT
jgi:hypothetical protein